MAMTRCTCIYRMSTSDEQRDGATAVSVATIDPWCPASALHARASTNQAMPSRVPRRAEPA
jgi:hypothetical protein